MKKVISFFSFLFSFSLIYSQGIVISTIAGNGYNHGTGNGGYSGNGGQATLAELNLPADLAIDKKGNIYIGDYANNCVRKVDAISGIITMYAGIAFQGYSGDGGPATAAELNTPNGLAFDTAGNLYICERFNKTIRKVLASSGIISTVAGDGYTGYTGDNGPATKARMNIPCGVAVDDSGNIFISDKGNYVIREVRAATGIINTIAGGGSILGDGGPATACRLDGAEGLAVDSLGNVYTADFYHNEIRKITMSTGIISCVAGNNAIGGGYSGDGGPATAAEIEAVSIGIDRQGNLYFPDGNYIVRKVDAQTGIISTVAGIDKVFGYSGDGGLATAAEMFGPSDAKVDTAGNIYIADGVNNVIRKVTSTISTSIKEQKNNSSISIFPNPSTGIFNLSLSSIKENCNVEVFNILGEKVLKQILRSAQPARTGTGGDDNLINITNQPNGIYFYRVVSETGDLVGEGKIVKD